MSNSSQSSQNSILSDVSLLNDAELHSQLQILAAKERNITIEVLAHLREVERRKLYEHKDCGSIYEYAVKELKYSEAAAARRVNAMRLMKGFTGVSSSLQSGAINLTTMSAVQSFIRKDEKERGKKYTLDEKRQLLDLVENKSKRECEQILAERFPGVQTAQSKSAVKEAADKVQADAEIKIILSTEQRLKLDQVRHIMAPRKKGISYAELFEWMADTLIEQNLAASQATEDAPPPPIKKKKKSSGPQRKLRWKKKTKVKPQLRLLA